MKFLTIFWEFFKAIFALLQKPKAAITVYPIISPSKKDPKQTKYTLKRGFRLLGVKVPKNFDTDGASIPSMFWGLVGHPFSPPIIAYAIAHDYIYFRAKKILKKALKIENKNRKYRWTKTALKIFAAADKRLYLSMRECNRKWKAICFYYAVRLYSTLYFSLWKVKIAPILRRIKNKKR